MANASEEWLKKAVSEGHINYIEYNKFTYIKRIGEGGFGSVSKYEWNGSFKKYFNSSGSAKDCGFWTGETDK
ncbi:kinase-like protein [Gigaspora margarita]|uniref:Kinase-like protein n=1 Tax=Gigaspora margarita TaxID=4874 RepID=A0A8H3XKR6_GIGMA|nr:kinase-like protein [Gigaspora margarita]